MPENPNATPIPVPSVEPFRRNYWFDFRPGESWTNIPTIGFAKINIDKQVKPKKEIIPYSVFVGRFQPLHLGHLTLIRKELRDCQRLFIIIGSTQEARTMLNPWNANERIDMINKNLTVQQREHIFYLTERDHPVDMVWARCVQEGVNDQLGGMGVNWRSTKVRLIGVQEESRYDKYFSGWKCDFSAKTFNRINDANIRKEYFTNYGNFNWRKGLAKRTSAFMEQWTGSNYYASIQELYNDLTT